MSCKRFFECAGRFYFLMVQGLEFRLYQIRTSDKKMSAQLEKVDRPIPHELMSEVSRFLKR